MEDDSNASAPTETHPLLPLQPEASNSTESGIGSAEAGETAETSVGATSTNNANTPTANDEDVTDDCCRKSTPPCGDDEGIVSDQPKTTGVQSEYKAIIDMLKDAEKTANDPEYEEKMHAKRFGAIKYNPRNQESSFGAVDYFCAFFQCCAVCIEG